MISRQGKRCDSQGFTLAELLIVVAIIAVLVAVAIPLFTTQLEKGRESTDLANARAAYAEVMNAYICQETAPGNGIPLSANTYSKTIDLEQKKDDWQTSKPLTLGGVSWNGESDNPHWVGTPGEGGSCTVSYSEVTGIVFTWSGGSANGGGAVSFDHIGDVVMQTIADTMDELNLLDGYRYDMLHSNEVVGKTHELVDALAEKGLDLDALGAKSWTITLAGRENTNNLDGNVIYWSTVDISDKASGTKVPLMGYNAGTGCYDVYYTTVADAGATGSRYKSLKTFTKVINTSATFQYGSYEDAKKAYDYLYEQYEKGVNIANYDSILKAAGLNG